MTAYQKLHDEINKLADFLKTLTSCPGGGSAVDVAIDLIKLLESSRQNQSNYIAELQLKNKLRGIQPNYAMADAAHLSYKNNDICESCNPEIIKLKTRIIELVSAARAVVEEFDEEKKGRNYVKRDYFGDGFVVSFNDLQKLKKLIEEPTND